MTEPRDDRYISDGNSTDNVQPSDSLHRLRVVETGRTLETINAAARRGYRPLIKPVVPNDRVHYMIAVFQDPVTREVWTSSDMRSEREGEIAIEYMMYYPYHFPNPFAAYLVPADIEEGEVVWLEDVIEDMVAIWGNQGYHPRLEKAKAIWNGKDFDVQFDPIRDAPHWVG